LIQHLFKDQKYKISSKQLQCIVKATEGYSGSDLKALCKEAALGPIRELGTRVAHVRSEEEIRPIQAQDMEQALHRIRPSVSKETVKVVEEWSEQRGVRG
jgi:SpoVK/Ycf46/Vps4 family AAA+-type ATPase